MIPLTPVQMRPLVKLVAPVTDRGLFLCLRASPSISRCARDGMSCFRWTASLSTGNYREAQGLRDMMPMVSSTAPLPPEDRIND